jgi:isoquinoline 1-oxidoreductase alpha subunit
MTTHAFTFTVNGKEQAVSVDKDKPLLWVLREDLGLTGTKYGCGIAMCGACTVLISDLQDKSPDAMIPVRSCMIRAKDVQGRKIKTIEGLSGTTDTRVQQAWIDEEVPQCGYCQSGQIMTTIAFLDALPREKPELNDDEINAALAGNLCRCGTYVRIRKAVKAAWSEVRKANGDRQ